MQPQQPQANMPQMYVPQLNNQRQVPVRLSSVNFEGVFTSSRLNMENLISQNLYNNNQQVPSQPQPQPRPQLNIPNPKSTPQQNNNRKWWSALICIMLFIITWWYLYWLMSYIRRRYREGLLSHWCFRIEPFLRPFFQYILTRLPGSRFRLIEGVGSILCRNVDCTEHWLYLFFWSI